MALSPLPSVVLIGEIALSTTSPDVIQLLRLANQCQARGDPDAVRNALDFLRLRLDLRPPNKALDSPPYRFFL